MKCSLINVLPVVLRFLESFIQKFWFVEAFLENSSDIALIWFTAGFTIVQSSENYIQMSLCM